MALSSFEVTCRSSEESFELEDAVGVVLSHLEGLKESEEARKMLGEFRELKVESATKSEVVLAGHGLVVRIQLGGCAVRDLKRSIEQVL